MKEIIYFGGSFNPPHIAHVLFVVALHAYFPDAEILVAPTYSHAFHKTLMPYDLRLKMLHAVFDDFSGVTVSEIERELHESTSYTIDVVRALIRENPNAVISIAVGSDILSSLHLWRSYDELCSIAKFLVFPREGYDNTKAVNMPHLPEVSSSEIREKLEKRDFEAVQKLVPKRIFDMLIEEWMK